MRVEVVTIGDELLLGFTIDTNAAFLARHLAELGVSIRRRTTCGDRAEDIVSAVGAALERADGVITTGGLGPTADDLSKPAIARLFGRGLVFHPEPWEHLRRLWRERGRPGEPPEINKQQMMLPDGATVLTNRHGSAPGVFITNESGRWLAMLPGVPREMRGIFVEELEPLLRSRIAGNVLPVRSRTLRTTGIPESQLGERLGDLAGGIPPLSLAYLPGVEGVELRLTCRTLEASAADAALEAGVARLRERVGTPVYGEGTDDLAAVVLTLCRQQGVRLAVAESCTGGLLGARLTEVPGASDVFIGGTIAYDNEVKRRELGVSAAAFEAAGAVSEEVVQQMALGAATRFGAELALAITGIAGPSGGSQDKPVGSVWIAAAYKGESRAIFARLFGDRREIRERAAQAALDLARRSLLSF